MPRDTKKNKPAEYIEEHILLYTHRWVPAGTPIDGYSTDDEGNLLRVKRGYWEEVCTKSHHFTCDAKAYLNTRFKNQQEE